MDKVRVIVADDHHILLDGLKALLQKQKDVEVVGLYSNGKLLYEALADVKANVALVDINMPEMDGFELTVKIKENYPEIAVIVLSMHDDASHIMQLIEAGASGYLLKNINDKELMDAIRAVANGKNFFSSEVSEKLTAYALQQQRRIDEPPQPRLTDRELDILRLIAKEFSNAGIAAELFISERTVETHRKNMLRKTNNKTIVGLVKYAMENKLL